MANSKLNYWVDFLMGVSFLITAISGLILLLFLPSGVRQGRFVDLTRGNWGTMHNWMGILCILFVLTHVLLHW
jgi:hypothetical protein